MYDGTIVFTKYSIYKIYVLKFLLLKLVLMVKNPPANAEDTRVIDSIPGSRRSHEIRNGNPLQYSCLENPMDRGAWQATVHRITRVRHDLLTKPPP